MLLGYPKADKLRECHTHTHTHTHKKKNVYSCTYIAHTHTGQELQPSMLLGYPKADKPRKHQPTVTISKSLGHQPLTRKGAGISDMDETQIVSQTGMGWL